MTIARIPTRGFVRTVNAEPVRCLPIRDARLRVLSVFKRMEKPCAENAVEIGIAKMGKGLFATVVSAKRAALIAMPVVEMMLPIAWNVLAEMSA